MYRFALRCFKSVFRRSSADHITLAEHHRALGGMLAVHVGELADLDARIDELETENIRLRLALDAAGVGL
jgi:hypothetical protein